MHIADHSVQIKLHTDDLIIIICFLSLLIQWGVTKIESDSTSAEKFVFTGFDAIDSVTHGLEKGEILALYVDSVDFESCDVPDYSLKKEYLRELMCELELNLQLRGKKIAFVSTENRSDKAYLTGKHFGSKEPSENTDVIIVNAMGDPSLGADDIGDLIRTLFPNDKVIIVAFGVEDIRESLAELELLCDYLIYCSPVQFSPPRNVASDVQIMANS